MRRPTIRDVARMAGVSHGTVSRYLNGGKWVGAESSDAISIAIRETGFRANRVARSLATGRASAIGVLLTQPQDRLFGDPNYAVLLGAITSALDRQDRHLIVMTASTEGERARALDFATAGHVDGVVLLSAAADDPINAALAECGIPAISCGRIGGDIISSVAADDRAGARRGVEHLIASGRRRIATVTGPTDVAGGQDRLAGYAEALEAAGLPFDPELVIVGDWSHASGRIAGARLAEGPSIDAVFASNDAMAVGVVAAMHAAGRSVPDDVAVVGFDDAGIAFTCDPPLTTLRQPFATIGAEIVRLVLDPPPSPLALTVPTELIVRESAP
ncbi:LacI family DNA-binding transcriptional regulator [Microbacterium sp. P5_E9]